MGRVLPTHGVFHVKQFPAAWNRARGQVRLARARTKHVMPTGCSWESGDEAKRDFFCDVGIDAGGKEFAARST